MKRLATLLTVAGISLVAYSGAVYATLVQEIPDSAPEPVYSAVEIVEESTAEIQSQEIPEVQVTKPIVIALEPEPIDTRPEWRKFLDEQSLKGGAYAEAVDCIDNWSEYTTATNSHRTSYLSDFQYRPSESKDNIVHDIFDKTLRERNCAKFVI